MQNKIHSKKASPSVAECINRIVAKMLRRRPANWQSLIRPQKHRSGVPFRMLNDNREGLGARANLRPPGTDNLKNEIPNGIGNGEKAEIFPGASFVFEIVAPGSASGSSLTHKPRKPDMHAFRKLKRLPKPLARLRAKESSRKWSVRATDVHMIENHSSLKGKRG